MFAGGSPSFRTISEPSRGLATRHNRDRLGFPLLVSVPTDSRNSGAHGFIVVLAEVSLAVVVLAGASSAESAHTKVRPLQVPLAGELEYSSV
jgi:hypothetical protein